MANLQKKNEIKERFNLFQYKTVDFTLRLNITTVPLKWTNRSLN